MFLFLRVALFLHVFYSVRSLGIIYSCEHNFLDFQGSVFAELCQWQVASFYWSHRKSYYDTQMLQLTKPIPIPIPGICKGVIALILGSSLRKYHELGVRRCNHNKLFRHIIDWKHGHHSKPSGYVWWSGLIRQSEHYNN